MNGFKDIPGWEGLYMVSDDGRVYSVRRKKIMSPMLNRGYYEVTLRRPGELRLIGVHRLVLLTWCPHEDSSLLQCNHKNGNRADNRVENLEWVTPQENIRHKFDVLGARSNGGLRPKPVVGVSKNTGDRIYFPSIMGVEQAGFSPREVCRICRRSRGYYAHRGYYWSYTIDDKCEGVS